MKGRKKDLRGYSSAHCSTGVERATGIACVLLLTEGIEEEGGLSSVQQTVALGNYRKAE